MLQTKTPIFICSEAILDEVKAKAYFKSLKDADRRASRFSSLQLNDPESEWDLIQIQHRLLSNNLTIAHLVLPVEGLTVSETKTEFSIKIGKKLYHSLNTEGWLIYCRWINQEMESVLKTFQPEDAEEYQLQALLEDFGHESRSPFLLERQNAMKEAMKQLQEGAQPPFQLEKQMVSIRESFKSLLTTNYFLLNEITAGISKIESLHPELAFLKEQAFLLQYLLGPEIGQGTISLSIPQRLMGMQLLDQALGVISSLNGHKTLTDFVYSLREAISHYSLEAEIIFNWNDLVIKRDPLVRQIQARFLDNLLQKQLKAKEPIHGVSKVNPDLLYLLPRKHENIQWVEFDTKSGMPIGLTEVAYKKLFS